MTATFTCDKFRPVKSGDEVKRGDLIDEVESASDAARVFAHRMAQREYGKRGYCHHVRQDTRYVERDGTVRYINYEAFIGRTVSGGMTSGHNVWLTVHINDE